MWLRGFCTSQQQHSSAPAIVSPPTFSCPGVTDHAKRGAVKLIILRVLPGGSARLLQVLHELRRRGHPREVGGGGEEFTDKAVQLSQ